MRIHTRTHTHTHTHMHSLSCSLHLGGPCLLMGPVGLSAGGDSQPQGQQEMGRRVGSQEEGGEGLLRFQEAGRPGLVLAALSSTKQRDWGEGSLKGTVTLNVSSLRRLEDRGKIHTMSMYSHLAGGVSCGSQAHQRRPLFQPP